MKNNMKKLRLALFSALACLFLQSCNDFLDVDPKHAASETQQWKTLEDTRSALMGVYGLTRAALADNNTHWICGDLRKGDFTVYKLFFYRFVYSVDTNHIARAAVSYDDIISYNSRKMTMCC